MIPYVSTAGEATKFAISLWTSGAGYRYLGDGDTNRRDILHDRTYVFRMCHLRFGGGSPGDPQIRSVVHLTANISKTLHVN